MHSILRRRQCRRREKIYRSFVPWTGRNYRQDPQVLCYRKEISMVQRNLAAPRLIKTA